MANQQIRNGRVFEKQFRFDPMSGREVMEWRDIGPAGPLTGTPPVATPFRSSPSVLPTNKQERDALMDLGHMLATGGVSGKGKIGAKAASSILAKLPLNLTDKIAGFVGPQAAAKLGINLTKKQVKQVAKNYSGNLSASDAANLPLKSQKALSKEAAKNRVLRGKQNDKCRKAK